MKATGRLIAAGAVALALAGGASATEEQGVDTVLAEVNGVEITLGHAIALRGRLPAQYQGLPDEVLFEGILDQLIQQTVLMQAIEAEVDRRMSMALENDRRAFLASQMVTRLAEAEVAEADLRAAYDEAMDGYVPDPEYNASHILLETEEEAREVAALLADGADFAELARARSTGPSGPEGGDLGWFGPGAMVQPFEEAVMTLAVGEVSGPVQTRFGWHVIRLDDMRTGTPPSLDEVRAELTMILQRQRVEQALADLLDAATIDRRDADVDRGLIRDGTLFDR